MAISGNLYDIVYDALIDFLRAQVIDPLSGRVEWIVGAYPPLKYAKPVVALNKIGKTFQKEVSHGDTGEISAYRFNLSIFTAGKKHVTINSTDYAGSSLLQYLAGKFDKAIKQNRTWWHTTYPEWFIDISLVTAQDVPYRETLDEYRTDMNIIITVIELW